MSAGNTRPPSDGTSQGKTAYDVLAMHGIAGIESALAEIPADTPEYQGKLLAALAAVSRRNWPEVRALLAEVTVPESDRIGAWLTGRSLALSGEAGKAVHHVMAAARQTGPELSSGESYRIGRIAMAAGAWNEAAAAFGFTYRKDSAALPALFQQGIAEFRGGKWNEAASTLRLVIRAMPTSTEVIGFLGFALVFTNEMDEAEAEIRRALGRSPGWFEARMRMGDLLLRRARFPEARDWFGKLVADHPKSHWARYFYGLALQAVARDSKHLNGAESALRRLEADDEGYHFLPAGLASGWYTVGVAYLHVEDYERAVTPLKRALALAPARSRYRLQLATALFELQRFAETISVLRARKLTGTAEEARAALLRGFCHLELKQAAHAIKAFQESTAVDPMNADAFVALGRANLMLGDLQQAENALAAASRINPRLPSMKNATRELEAALGRHMDEGAGLGRLSGFSIPTEFALNLADEGLARPRLIRAGLLSHGRAIQAIIRREMLGRYGRNQLGYIWAVLQPLLYVATLELIFLVAQRRVPLGVTLEQFLITGILPVVCFFMNIETKVTAAINVNKNLLYFREVSTLNILVGAWLLEFLTAMTAMMIILAGLYLTGQSFIIKDKLEVVGALFGISALAAVIGGLIGVLSLRWHSAIFIGRSLNRGLFFLSGAFFYADELPPQLRQYILLNPLFHYVELVRDGFFVSYQAVYVTWVYPMLFIIPGLFLLLLSDRVFRRHVFET